MDSAVYRKIPLLSRGLRKCRLKALSATSRNAARPRHPASRATVRRRLRNTRLLPGLAPYYRANPAIIGACPGARRRTSVDMHENFSLPFRRRLCHPSGAMIHAKLTQFALPLSLAGLLLVAGCNKNQSPQNAEQPAASQPAPASTPAGSTPGTSAAASAPANTPPPPPPPPPQPVSYTIPAGTRVTVRLG